MTKIEKIEIENLDIVTVTSDKIKKYYITAHPEKNGNEYSMFQHLLEYINKENATILSQFVFGDSNLYDVTIQELNDLSNGINWPVTWLHGDSCSCNCLTGTQLMAISGVEVKSVSLDGEIVGSVYEDDDAQYCLLGNLHSKDAKDSNSENSRLAFEKMKRALATIDMDFSNVIRMWNYLDDLLNWYDDFNVMRTAFFNENNVFNQIVPAGTGIGAKNAKNVPYMGELFAVKAKNTDVKYFPVGSPLQCPAVDYKSSFSRAVELDLIDHKHLFISGSASIEPGGKTVHLDDVPKQIELTMKVVSAILESRNMDWSDTARAIVYFKDLEKAPLLDEFLSKNNYPKIPIAISHADVCRDDLLFEIELEAIK